MKKRILNLFKSKLIVDSFWALFGNVIFKGLALLAGIIVANLLGKDVFGEFSILKGTLVALGLLTTFGLGYTATKFVADYKEEKSMFLYSFFLYGQKIVLIFSSIVTLLVLIFANEIATLILENKDLTIYLRFVAILIIFNSLNHFYIGYLSGLGLFKKMAKINAFIGICTFVFTVVLAYYYGLTGALISLVLIQVLNILVNYKLIIKNTSNLNNLLTPKEKRRVVNYSLPIAFQEAIYSIITWLISFLILYYSNYGELGMYTAAIQLNAMVLFIPSILRNVILSHLSRTSKDNAKHNSILKTVLVINFIATLVPCLIVFFLSDFIAGFYGNTFNGLSELIKTAIFTTVFVSVSNVYAQAYMSKNLNWTMLAFRIVRDLGTILFFIYLVNIDFLGAESMIYSKLVLSAIFMVIMMFFYKVYIRKEVK